MRQLLVAGALGPVAAQLLVRPFGLHDTVILGPYLRPLAVVGWAILFDGVRGLGGQWRLAPGSTAVL